MKLKLDDNGNVVLHEGKPVYVAEDGKEIPVDVPQLFNKITQLNEENKEHRERAEELAKQLEPLKDIEDIAEFKKMADDAIEKVKNFTDKDLIEAGKVEEIKKEMKAAHEEEKNRLIKSFQEKETDYLGKLENKDKTIYQLMVSSKFSQSPYFSGERPKTLLPPEIAETYFGKHFKVEEEKDGSLRVVGYLNGNPIYSRKNPGEIADFDEALESIIDNYPLKDKILRPSSSRGSGATGGGTGVDVPPKDKLAVLESQYEEARKAGDAKLAITIKNRIFDLKRAQQ